MEVYVLQTNNDYEGATLLGVFETPEQAAKAAMENINETYTNIHIEHMVLGEFVPWSILEHPGLHCERSEFKERAQEWLNGLQGE